MAKIILKNIWIKNLLWVNKIYNSNKKLTNINWYALYKIIFSKS